MVVCVLISVALTLLCVAFTLHVRKVNQLTQWYLDTINHGWMVQWNNSELNLYDNKGQRVINYAIKGFVGWRVYCNLKRRGVPRSQHYLTP